MDGLRFVVSDVLWRRLEPYFPGKTSDCGVTAKDNRLFLDAVFWRVRTGSPWVALGRLGAICPRLWQLEQPVPAVSPLIRNLKHPAFNLRYIQQR